MDTRPAPIRSRQNSPAIRLNLSRRSNPCRCESDERAIDNTGSQTGVTAEYYEPKAPAVRRDEYAERNQQSAGAGDAEAVDRGRP